MIAHVKDELLEVIATAVEEAVAPPVPNTATGILLLSWVPVPKSPL
jgi:hypothetical protein